MKELKHLEISSVPNLYESVFPTTQNMFLVPEERQGAVAETLFGINSALQIVDFVRKTRGEEMDVFYPVRWERQAEQPVILSSIIQQRRLEW